MSTTTCIKERTKDGNNFAYQFGVGHNMQNGLGVTILGLIECTGVYSQRDHLNGRKQENSGGNIIYLGPAISICQTRWQIEAGIQLPVYQKNNGTGGDKQKFRSTFSLLIRI